MTLRGRLKGNLESWTRKPPPTRRTVRGVSRDGHRATGTCPRTDSNLRTLSIRPARGTVAGRREFSTYIIDGERVTGEVPFASAPIRSLPPKRVETAHGSQNVLIIPAGALLLPYRRLAAQVGRTTSKLPRSPHPMLGRSTASSTDRQLTEETHGWTSTPGRSRCTPPFC